jgi:ubiquinone/menaquinone biosynthesis C-methylase UbiE
MDRNPQREQMADESMVTTLAAQAQAIWPQEGPLFDRYGLAPGAHIVDVGCGTGEITSRLAGKFGTARVLGIDVIESSIEYAQKAHAALAPRLQFRVGDAFALDLPANSVDLAVCRHMTQSVPHVELVVAELQRVTRPGGWVHMLSEDYGMLHMPVTPLNADRLWSSGPVALGRATNTDARIGRRTWNLFVAAGLKEVRVDYVIVDTLRVPRETFATFLQSWRDGFSEALASTGELTAGEVHALFDQVIGDVRDPTKYSVWHVPVISGRKA